MLITEPWNNGTAGCCCQYRLGGGAEHVADNIGGGGVHLADMLDELKDGDSSSNAATKALALR
jgi:hypothetical protein